MFEKVLGNSFKGYRQVITKILNRSSLNSKIYFEVEDELVNLNSNILNQIITASGPFDPKIDERAHSNFTPSKNKKKDSP